MNSCGEMIFVSFKVIEGSIINNSLTFYSVNYPRDNADFKGKIITNYSCAIYMHLVLVSLYNV